MEFYSLNRLYDENQPYFNISKLIDHYLLVLMPVIVSFGCGISIISIFVFSSCSISPYVVNNSKLQSKKFLLSQSIFNFLFQITSSIILITNYYENFLINNYSFSNNKYLNYLNVKQALNYFYEIVFYCSIWVFIVGALEFSIIAILKYHIVSNYVEIFQSKFLKQKNQLSNQLKLLEKLEELKNYEREKELKKQNSLQSQSGKTKDGSERSSDSDETFLSVKNPVNSSHPSYLKNEDSDVDVEKNQQKTDAQSTALSLDQSQKENQEIVETVYCTQKKVIISILMIIVSAALLALPQLFAYEINRIFLSVSPVSLVNSKNKQSDQQHMPLDVYFIPQDNEKSDYYIQKKQMKFDYSSNIAKAYALTIEFHIENEQINAILELMKKTHSNFFSPTSYFYLASRNYDFCNLIENAESSSKPMFTFKNSYIAPNSSINTSPILNLTIFCLKKSYLHKYLAYNTIYFWFEHTMVISVPFTVSLVLLILLLIVCVKMSKLVTYEAYLREQRKKFQKIQEKNINTLNQYNSKIKNKVRFTKIYKKSRQTLISTSSTNGYYDESVMLPPDFQYPELNQEAETKADDNIHHLGVMRYGMTNDNNDEIYQQKQREYYNYYIQQQQMLLLKKQQKQKKKFSKTAKKAANNGDFLNCFFKIDFKETNLEKKIKIRQNEDQNLNKMFIMDIIIYFLISFPYTFLRLILDLFIKDKIKFSLDFFILYKLAFLTFHIHLILKFFLMLTFNIRFRANFSRAFAFEPSLCCVNNGEAYNSNLTSHYYSNQSMSTNSLQIKNNSCLFKFCCFLCTSCFLSKIFGHYFKNQNSTNRFNNLHSGATYITDEIERSTEFNTTHHQLQCPADPDQLKDC